MFKGNENYELENYRPISMLPCLSKITESDILNKNSLVFSLVFRKVIPLNKETKTETFVKVASIP